MMQSRRYPPLQPQPPARRSPVLIAVVVAAGIVVAAAVTFFLWYRGVSHGSPDTPTASSCATRGCHSTSLKQAKMFVTADGQPVGGPDPALVAAGDSFQISAYFQDLLGDINTHQKVSVEIVVPEDPPWSVHTGTAQTADNAPVDTSGGVAWNPAWGSSAGRTWLLASENSRHYYLGSEGTDPGPKGENTGVNDTGGASDPDHIANTFGTNAMISVPLRTKPGLYKVAVYGIGFTGGGSPGYTVTAFNVAVTSPQGQQGSALVGTTAPQNVSGESVYATTCGGCHGATPNTALLQELANGRDWTRQAIQSRPDHAKLVTDTTIEPLLDYLMDRQAIGSTNGAPPIPHSLDGRSDCMSCHGPGGIAPQNPDHSASLGCTSCHRVLPASVVDAPLIPHPSGPSVDCLSCHGANPEQSLPSDHSGRANATCSACHSPGPQPPAAPHTLEGRLRCLTCHAPDSNIPVPADHAGRRATTCLFCHKVPSQ